MLIPPPSFTWLRWREGGARKVFCGVHRKAITCDSTSFEANDPLTCVVRGRRPNLRTFCEATRSRLLAAPRLLPPASLVSTRSQHICGGCAMARERSLADGFQVFATKSSYWVGSRWAFAFAVFAILLSLIRLSIRSRLSLLQSDSCRCVLRFS